EVKDHLANDRRVHVRGSGLGSRMLLGWFGVQGFVHGKVIYVVFLVVNRVFVLFGHDQAVRRTGEGAERAVTALGHVDVEDVGAQFNRRAVGGKNLGFVFRPLFSLDDDAIGRTHARALAAADTVLDLVEQ